MPHTLQPAPHVSLTALVSEASARGAYRLIMRPFFLTVAVVVGLVVAQSTYGDDADQDKARAALESGQIRSLDQVLGVARQKWPGEIVKVELEHDDGDWIYQIKILSDQGERHEVEIDAATLRVRKAD